RRRLLAPVANRRAGPPRRGGRGGAGRGQAPRRPRPRAHGGGRRPPARGGVVARKVALTVRTLGEAGIGPGARLLDAGCGQGWYVAALVAAGYRVVGIELAPGQIAA